MIITFNAKIIRAYSPILSKNGKFKLIYFQCVNNKRYYSKKTGKTVEKAFFINCICIKKAESNIEKFEQRLCKGQMVNILSDEYPELGKPYTSQKTGETYSTARLTVKNLNFIGKPTDMQAFTSSESPVPDDPITSTLQPDPMIETNDNTADDLPF